MWYRHTPGGYSLVGETDTPEGASMRKATQAARPPLHDPREHPTQCKDCGDELPAGMDPIDAGWTVGRKDGEFICDECNTNWGEAHTSSIIPDDGYADGGEPYTDEEMDIIEGAPTPPLARDRADESGERVRDCFGEWHEPHGAGRPKAGLDYGGLVRRIVAEESEGARRERETHELRQQYESPAWKGDNRRPKPGQQDMETVRRLDKAKWDAYHEMTNMFDDGTAFGAVMYYAHEQSGAMENDHNILQVSKAIASGRADAREWFSRLAEATEAFLDAGRAVAEADPDKIRDNGFKPKNSQ